MVTDSVLSWAGFAAALVVLVAACWSHRRWRLLREQYERLQADAAQKQTSLARMLERCDTLQNELGTLHDKLGRDETQIEQLRDLVKVHVARRREFDEWASPIRTSLGESFGHTLRALKEQIERQEFALQRQERIAANAEAQYLSKNGELERMHRELALKNYHIAALNERFIRVEERMHELGAQVAAMGLGRAAKVGREPVAPATVNAVPLSPETERFSVDKGESREWMAVLDDWHRQLHERLDRLDELQAQLRTRTSHPGAPRDETPARRGAAGAP